MGVFAGYGDHIGAGAAGAGAWDQTGAGALVGPHFGSAIHLVLDTSDVWHCGQF